MIVKNEFDGSCSLVGIFSFIWTIGVTTAQPEEDSPDPHSLWSIIDFQEKIGN